MSGLDARQLRYFSAIAEEGSLSAAALKIGIAQPSLSQHIKQLEERLGVRLLSRSPRGVALTEAGTIMLDHARNILAAMERAEEDVRQAGSEPRGQVTFGLPSSVSMVLSVPLAETVRLELPRIRFCVTEAMSGYILEWLEDGSIDLAILYQDQSVRHMEARQILSETLQFFAASDAWPLDTPPGTPVTLAEVAKQDLVLPSPTHGLRAMIERYAKAAGISLNIWLEMDALTQIKELVARGSAGTILAPASVQARGDDEDLVSAPIIAPQMRRPVFLVRNPARRLTRATMEVERITHKVIAELVDRGLWQATGTAGSVAD